ncbi:MAG: acyl--CoA ligase [Bdellovibrionaceae bacterium]|nr:acyl--CoA ligase [Pseudobdellovibrionaceae bacterium]
MSYWGDQLKTWAHDRPRRPALIDSHSSLQWNEINQMSATISSALGLAGITSGGSVIATVPRSVQAAALIISCLRSSIAGVTIERSSFQSRLPSIIKTSCFDAVIFLQQQADEIKKALGPQATEKYREFSLPFGLMGLGLKAERARRVAGWYLQTSGSTREPLTAALSENDLIKRAIGERRDFNIKPDFHILNVLSFAHDLGLNQLLCAIASGTTLTIHTNPFSNKLADLLQERPFEGITGTPVIWSEYLKLTPKPVRGLQFLTVSGGSLPVVQLRKIASLFPDCALLKTYGQTETFRSLMCRNPNIESLGEPIPDVTLRIVDSNGADCPTDETGELVHYGDGRMLEYLNAPTQSAQKAFDGGIRTGDLFRRDHDGQYVFCGRNDDMIKRWDQRLHLREIELCALTHPAVEQAIAISKPAVAGDPRQNLVCLFVIAASGLHLDRKHLLRHCKEQLTPYKVPDDLCVLDKGIPYTVSRKIDRLALKALWESGLS